MITFEHTGSFKNTDAFLKKLSSKNLFGSLDSLAQEGVAALSAATPSDTHLAASSWNYKIVESPGMISIFWTNSDIEDGFPVALRLQYGYGTGTGGYVQGRDYINPAMKPVFDKILDKAWKAVTSA